MALCELEDTNLHTESKGAEIPKISNIMLDLSEDPFSMNELGMNEDET